MSDWTLNLGDSNLNKFESLVFKSLMHHFHILSEKRHQINQTFFQSIFIWQNKLSQ